VRATAILPVKSFPRAKTRLAETVGKPGRAKLMRAMLADTLAALEAAERIERIILVSAEGRAQRLALEAAKRYRTPIEVVQEQQDLGHSQAATIGIVRAKALGAACAVLVPGDCPLLAPRELDELVASLGECEVAVVPDRHGTGTNALVMAPADAIAPAFGEGSCERHLERARRAGMTGRRAELPSLALDLDTPDDLARLRAELEERPDDAPATARALRELR
jgi:2-phospho-L-lactate guanylyltransferase